MHIAARGYLRTAQEVVSGGGAGSHWPDYPPVPQFIPPDGGAERRRRNILRKRLAFVMLLAN